MLISEPKAWQRADAAPRTLSPSPRVHGGASVMPRERRDAAQPAKEGQPLEAGSPSPEMQQVTVLVAEDEETIAETLAMIVEDAGYLALVARDGREALALARQHRPQLIITDLMMPYLSGAELIAAVHGAAAAQGYVPPPIVVVTAASRVIAQQAGADIVITKPFDVSKIEAAMERLLGDQPS